MGNTISIAFGKYKKLAWEKKLQNLDDELEETEKKKSLYVNYKDSFTDKAYWILILAAIIFVILLFCSLHIAAVSVLVAAPVLYKGFKSGAGYVFDQLIKHCNYTISKLHVDKTSVVEEIKHSASYYETKALLAGRDPEVGRSVALNLEPLEY